MPGPMFVLLLTENQQLRNLVEQLFIIDGVTTLTATTMDEGETLIGHVGSASIGLVIMDTAVFGTDDLQQQQGACQALRAWTAAYLNLSYLVVGSVLQRAAILPEYTDIVQFLVKPFRLGELVSAVCGLWSGRPPLTGKGKGFQSRKPRCGCPRCPNELSRE